MVYFWRLVLTFRLVLWQLLVIHVNIHHLARASSRRLSRLATLGDSTLHDCLNFLVITEGVFLDLFSPGNCSITLSSCFVASGAFHSWNCASSLNLLYFCQFSNFVVHNLLITLFCLFLFKTRYYSSTVSHVLKNSHVYLVPLMKYYTTDFWSGRNEHWGIFSPAPCLMTWAHDLTKLNQIRHIAQCL